ncbi:MAG: DUF1361 domain-containing protein [Chloroflexi bacterium]|nr:DUF1361 domain-containing protein [Chloroflexota bacterium]MDL1941839.1 DUF1361 domain-containing protein [Chloroflexi bacterium CFX2]
MKTLYKYIQPYRFRLTIFAQLCGATLLSLMLFRLRVRMSGSGEYAFLVWNIFLAWIPLGLAYAATAFSWSRKSILLTLPFAAGLWLIFFPNAPYILTDLLHLSDPKPHIPLWFDVLLLLWFAWTGLSLGMVSLFLMQSIVRREFGRIAGWLFVGTVGVLGALGIYIGRFLRWNSWDLLLSPKQRLAEFLHYAANPSLQSIVFISVFSALFIFIYVSTYTFGLLLQEQTNKAPQEIS